MDMVSFPAAPARLSALLTKALTRTSLGLLVPIAASAAKQPMRLEGMGQGEKSFEERALEAGDEISKGLGSTAELIDITLAGRKYTKKPNPSTLDIRQLFTWTEGGRFRPSTDFGLNLRLPNLERRWRLRFSSYDEEVESRNLTQKRVKIRPREVDYGAGLLFFERLGNIRTFFQPRVRLKNPIDVSYLLRFESESEWKPVRLNPRIDFFADPSKGTGEFASLEIVVSLSERWELSQQNSEEYRAHENRFSTQHGIGLERGLSDTQSIGVALSIESHNRPAYHMDSYTVSTAYGQQIYPKRLNYSVTPFLAFTKASSFKGSPGLTLALTLMF